MSNPTLAPDEIEALTGVRQPAAQLRRLIEWGFTRARIAGGRVIVERPHFEAVSAGKIDPESNRPKVRHAA
jgi:Domain of unknown function (DUF4224)